MADPINSYYTLDNQEIFKDSSKVINNLKFGRFLGSTFAASALITATIVLTIMLSINFSSGSSSEFLKTAGGITAGTCGPFLIAGIATGLIYQGKLRKQRTSKELEAVINEVIQATEKQKENISQAKSGLEEKLKKISEALQLKENKLEDKILKFKELLKKV